MFALLQKRPGFRRLWLGTVISMLGDWLTYVAVSVLAIEKGEGAMAIAFVLVAHQLPQAVLSPIAGPIADRFDRRAVLLFAVRAQAIATALMVVAALWGSLWAVQVLLMARTSLVAFFDTAENAAVPRLVEEDEVSLASSLSAGTWSVMFALGVALGGVLVAWVGAIAAIAIDALTFVGASLLLAGLPRMAPVHEGSADRGSGLAAAWRYAEPRPRVLIAVFAKTPIAFATGAAWVYLVERSEAWALLGASSIMLGALHAVRGIGTGVGPIFALSAESKRVSDESILFVSHVAACAGIALLAFAGGPFAALIAVFVWGLGTGANWVKSTSMLRTLVPDAYRGRLAGIDLWASALAVCCGGLLAGSVIDGGFDRAAAPMTGVVACGALVLALQRATVRRSSGVRPAAG